MQKEVEALMQRPYTVHISPLGADEGGGFVARIAELAGVSGHGDTHDEALADLGLAKRLWFEAALESNYSVPEPESLEGYGGRFSLRMPKHLHHDLVREADREGVSLNMLIVSELSRRVGLRK